MNSGQGPPPPSFGQNPKEQLLFSGDLPLAYQPISIKCLMPNLDLQDIFCRREKKLNSRNSEWIEQIV